MSDDHLHSQVVLCGLGRSTNRRAAKYDGCRAVIIETAERFQKFGMYTVIVLPDDDTKCVRMTVKMKYLRPYEPKISAASCESVIFGGYRGLFGMVKSGGRVVWNQGTVGNRGVPFATTGTIVYICAMSKEEKEEKGISDQARFVWDYKNGKYVNAQGCCAVMTGATNMNNQSKCFRTTGVWSQMRAEERRIIKKIDLNDENEMIEVEMLDPLGVERLLYLNPNMCHMEILGAAGRMAQHWNLKWIEPTTADKVQDYTVQFGIKVAAAMAGAGVGLIAAGPAIAGAIAGAAATAGVDVILNGAFAGKTYDEIGKEYAATGITEACKAAAGSVAGDHIKHDLIGDHKHYKGHWELDKKDHYSAVAQAEYKQIPAVAQGLADAAIGYAADLIKAGFEQAKTFLANAYGTMAQVVTTMATALLKAAFQVSDFVFGGIKYMCYNPVGALKKAYDAMANCAVFAKNVGKDVVYAVTVNGANFPAVLVQQGQLMGAYMITYGYFAGCYILNGVVLLSDGSVYMGGKVISCVDSIGHTCWQGIKDNPAAVAAIGTTIVVSTMVAPPVAALLGLAKAPVLLAGFTAGVTAAATDIASWAASQKKSFGRSFGRFRPKYRFGNGGGGVDKTQLHVPSSSGSFEYYYDSNGQLCRTKPPSGWKKVQYKMDVIRAMKK